MPVKYVILNVTIHCTIVTESIHKYPVKKNYDKLPSYATVKQSKQNEGKKEKKVRKKGGGEKGTDSDSTCLPFGTPTRDERLVASTKAYSVL